MRITRAQPADAALLTDIAFVAKRRWGYPESWIERWRAALTISPTSIANDETYAATIEERIVGFFALHNNEDKLELSHLWVLPEMMGRGIGRSLFAHAVERAIDLGFRQLTIESDPNAEGFYLRMGARRIGTSINDVEGQLRELPVLIYDVENRS